MAPYVIRIGPFDSEHRDAGQHTYVALVDQDDLEGVHAAVTEPSDLAGLRALLGQLEDQPVCEPALAEAASRLALPVGEPADPETITWWRHGLTLSVPITTSLEGVTQLEQVVQFAFASAGFLRASRFLAQHHLRPFQVIATGDVEREAIGLLLTDTEDEEPTLGFSLFPDEKHFLWHQRLMHGGFGDEFLRVDSMHVFQDTRERPYLAESLKWANLPHTMLASRIVEQKPVKVGPDELLLLTGILNALSDLGAETECAVETTVGERVIAVEIELLPPVDPPEIEPGGARA
jgi:hypothetical protein